MTSRMVGSVLTLVTLLFSVVGGAAQTYTQMQWGMNKGVTPYAFGANINGTWRDFGTVSAAGEWTLNNISVYNTGVNWITGGLTYHYDGLPVSIAPGLPDSAKFGYGYGSIVENISSSVDVPSGSNVLHTASIAGYMRTRGAPFAVGTFGACMQSENSAGGCWGLNTVSTNGPTVQPVTRTGYDFGFLGTELDINLMKKADNTAPTGNVVGLYLVGASETLPAAPSSADAIRVSQLGIGANIGWNTSLLMADGASNYGIWRGTANKDVNNTGSIPDAYVSRNSGGSTLISFMYSDPNGNFVLDPVGPTVRIFGGAEISYLNPLIFPDNIGHTPGSNGASIFNTSGTTYFDSYSGPVQFRGNGYAAIMQIATTGVTTSVPANFNSTATFGVSGTTAAQLILTNATSGSITISPATGALGTVTATLPANTGTIAETNLAQTFSATQTFSAGIISAGTKPTATGAGGTCAAGTVTGGALVGTVALTAVCASTNTLALTGLPAATTGYVCDAADRTTGVVNLVQTATTTTSATFTFNASTGATDLIQFKCMGY